MFLNDIDVFPHPEDVLWLLLLMLLAQQLRKFLAQRWHDESQLALVYVALASAETIVSRSTMDLNRAYRHGFLGMTLWLGMNLFLGRLRATYWKKHEIANPAPLLAAVFAHDEIPEANWVLQIISQVVGGFAGQMYLTTLSFPRKRPCQCSLPMKVAPMTAFVAEMLGSMTLELLVRGFKNSECDNPQHAFCISTLQLLGATGLVLATLDVSGAVYHPMAALVNLHLCLSVPTKNIEMVGIYIIAPCIGCVGAVILAPYAQILVRVVHNRLGH